MISTKLQEFSERHTGFTLNNIVNLEVNINEFESNNVSSSYIHLPEEIANQRAWVNVKNYDNACFAWTVDIF